MDALGIADGSHVADLGAGGGWFTERLAHRVGPNGIVYAEDIQPAMIDAITRRKNSRSLINVQPDPRHRGRSAAARGLHAVLMVDTYPQLPNPIGLLKNVAKALSPNGTLGVVDFKPDGGGGPGPPKEERLDPRVDHARRGDGRAEAAAARDVPAVSVPPRLREIARMASLPALFEPCQAEISRALETFVPDSPGSRVVEAMRYTLLAPSKRVRAILAMFAADVCSAGGAGRARSAACAIEAIHAASLMLDDLPSMDNAPLRRGRPTAHIAFGEAVTMLAAFGLLNAAFASLAGATSRRWQRASPASPATPSASMAWSRVRPKTCWPRTRRSTSTRSNGFIGARPARCSARRPWRAA